jgi:hypothetical protein
VHQDGQNEAKPVGDRSGREQIAALENITGCTVLDELVLRGRREPPSERRRRPRRRR